MIAFLEGDVIEESSESLVVMVGGVGYELFCSNNSMDDFFAQNSIRAWVHTHKREDVLMLFGFSTRSEKQLFESLIKVTGIGPKMAVALLSGAKIEDITRMIEAADAKGLSSLPKVGKKKAEQIILTLKGKLTSVEDFKKEKTEMASLTKKKVVSALVNLGFKSQDVDEAVAAMAENVSFEDGVRDGLAMLSGVK